MSRPSGQESGMWALFASINFTGLPARKSREGEVRMLDPREYKDWQIAAEAEKRLPSVETFREQLGLLPEEIIPFGKTRNSTS